MSREMQDKKFQRLEELRYLKEATNRLFEMFTDFSFINLKVLCFSQDHATCLTARVVNYLLKETFANRKTLRR